MLFNSVTGYDDVRVLVGLAASRERVGILFDSPPNPREHPILQTLVGPGEEHVSLAGIPTEASIFQALHDAMPGFVPEVDAHSAGGGKFLAILKCDKKTAFDDGRARQAALLAFGIYSELKNIILVDSDVDIFDTDDMLWAMQTRMQGDMDINIPGVSGRVLDPSQQPEYNPALPAMGTTAKTIFDATAPFRLKEHFERAHFRDVDPRPTRLHPHRLTE